MPVVVRFDRPRRILHSAVSGVLADADIEAWRDALEVSTADLAPTAEFRMLEDLTGHEVAQQDLAVHKRMREVGPRFLAAHGFAVGFWTPRTGTATAS